HQLVRLASRKADRELKISVIKGRLGYAPFEADTVKLTRRVLERLRVGITPERFMFVNYMEYRPLAPLAPGEYAIIGDSLADTATFKIKYNPSFYSYSWLIRACQNPYRFALRKRTTIQEK